MDNLKIILPFMLFSSFSFGQNQAQTSSRIQSSQNSYTSSEILNSSEEKTVQIRQSNQRIAESEQVIIIEEPTSHEEKEVTIQSTSNKRKID